MKSPRRGAVEKQTGKQKKTDRERERERQLGVEEFTGAVQMKLSESCCVAD